MGNPATTPACINPGNCNYGRGAPVTPTTTFGGQYDFSRAGEINVTPGSNRFGGTMRIFYRPEAFYYQYVYYFSPVNFKGYGGFSCLDEGMWDCTPGTFMSNPGDITAQYKVNWYLLNVSGTGTGKSTPPYSQSNKAKATTTRTAKGMWPTPNPTGNYSFLIQQAQYVNTIHPWTTGFASVKNPVGSPNVISPQKQGYDISLGGSDITVTYFDWNANFNKTLSEITYTTETYKQYLKNVGRVVSLVRPRLINTYSVPLDPSVDPISNTWQVARMWTMKVFFLPEPAGMLMLGVGIATLLGLSRMRRR
jgi:hypothetical protein